MASRNPHHTDVYMYMDMYMCSCKYTTLYVVCCMRICICIACLSRSCIYLSAYTYFWKNAEERRWQGGHRIRKIMANLPAPEGFSHICRHIHTYMYIHTYVYVYIYGFRSSMYITGTEIRIQHILLRFKLLVSRALILGPGEACHPSHFLSVDNLLCKK